MNLAFSYVHDIGAVKHPGSVLYDRSVDTYTVSGSGKNLWGGDDEFFFAATPLIGNFIMTANLEFIGKGVEAHRKAGLMARQSPSPTAAYADAAVHGDGLTSLQYRPADRGQTLEIKSRSGSANLIQLERRGSAIIMRIASARQPLQEVGRIALDWPEEVLVGLFVCSHNVDVVEKVMFHGVRIESGNSPE